MDDIESKKDPLTVRSNEVILMSKVIARFQQAYQDFLHVLNKISNKNFFKNVPWSDVKKGYKKKTGRVLNSEEMNSMVGTTGLSRYYLYGY